MPKDNGQLTAEELEPCESDILEAQALIDGGYEQTSSKYRHLARVPEGITAVDALELYHRSSETPEQTQARHEEDARRDESAAKYALLHSNAPIERKEVSVRVFRAYKMLLRKREREASMLYTQEVFTPPKYTKVVNLVFSDDDK